MKVDEFGANVARRLTAGLDNLDSGTQSRLRAVRERALDAYREPAAALAPAMATAGSGRGNFGRLPTILIPALFLLAALAAGLWWQQQQRDPTDLDVGLLTDEMPIKVYFERDFDQWLKNSSSR